MYLNYEQIPVAGVVLTAAALTIPEGTLRVQLQATGNNIRYTLDGVINPAVAFGMLLIVGHDPIWVEREDLANIHFISGAVGAALLDVNYYTTRMNV